MTEEDQPYRSYAGRIPFEENRSSAVAPPIAVMITLDQTRPEGRSLTSSMASIEVQAGDTAGQGAGDTCSDHRAPAGRHEPEQPACDSRRGDNDNVAGFDRSRVTHNRNSPRDAPVCARRLPAVVGGLADRRNSTRARDDTGETKQDAGTGTDSRAHHIACGRRREARERVRLAQKHEAHAAPVPGKIQLIVAGGGGFLGLSHVVDEDVEVERGEYGRDAVVRDPQRCQHPDDIEITFHRPVYAVAPQDCSAAARSSWALSVFSQLKVPSPPSPGVRPKWPWTAVTW